MYGRCVKVVLVQFSVTCDSKVIYLTCLFELFSIYASNERLNTVISL